MKKFTIIMLTFITLLTITYNLLLSTIVPAPNVGVDGAYAITHVNIINVVDGSIATDMTLLTREGVITNIQPTQSFHLPTGFKEISAKGKFIIPSLWDMHTHSLKISPQIHHPLYIRYGVTNIRDMSGCMVEDDSFWACIDDRKKWTTQALAGKRVSPRYVLQSSYQTDGGDEVPDDFPPFFKLNEQGDAKKLVAFYEAQGAKQIKVHAKISTDKYINLASELLKSNLDLVGHKPVTVSLEQALAYKQKSIEHARIFLFSCYKDSNKFRNLKNPVQSFDANLMRKMIVQQDDKECVRLMNKMAKSDTWWVPTLSTLRSAALANNIEVLNDDVFTNIPSLMKTLFWQPDLNKAKKYGFDVQGKFVHQDFFEKAQQQLKQASDRQVKILAGTDTLDSMIVAGYSLHDELAMMVDAGISPLKALQSATLSPAQYSNQEHKFGSIRVGKAADLLILNKNPLENIKNSRDINAVMFNGQLFDHAALSQLEQYSKEQGSSIKVNAQFLASALKSPLIRQQIAD
jgi:alpha-D-ribose 1-methylphosphonate 5-triphosphate diphosphatase PhnM